MNSILLPRYWLRKFYGITIKASCDPMMIYPKIFKMCPKGGYKPLYICDKSVIMFGKIKIFFDSATQIFLALGTNTR